MEREGTVKSEGTMEFYSPLFDQLDGSNLHSYVLIYSRSFTPIDSRSY